MSDIQYFHLPLPLQNTSTPGPPLPVHLAYRILNPTSPKTALIPTCFRGRLATTLTFAHSALRNHRIILVALFGNGESSSPSNTPGFPSTIDYRDCVHAQHALLQHLGITHLDLMLGFSMGGQCTYYWTVLYPAYISAAVIICSSARTSLHNYQFLEGPKAALENAIDYAGRESRESGGGDTARPALRGLRAFGKGYSAWLTSAEWFEERQFEKLGYRTLEEWDAAVAGRNYYGWDPEDLLAMLGMWQRGDIGGILIPDGSVGGEEKERVEDALRRIQARVLLMPCRTDQYFRPGVSEREGRLLRAGRVRVIPSIWGHLAGAGSNEEDVEWMDKRIAEFLEGSIDRG